MVKFPRRTVYLVLASILLLSLVVRYPLVEHERHQTDSYFIHLLSQSIVDDGYAVWVFHPLSYFGYYPFSYPSGGPFLLAEVSSLTGMSVELSILVTNCFFAALFCLAVFLLARQFISKPELVLLATFFSVLAARFVDTSYWDASARAPLIVLMVLAIFASMRVSWGNQKSMTGIAVVLGFGCFALHHMAVLLVVFGIGYMIAIFEVQYLIPRLRMRKRHIVVALNMVILVAVLAITYEIFDFAGQIGASPSDTSLFSIDPPWLSYYLNMGVSYTNQIGFVILLAALSVPGILIRARISVTNVFLLALIISFVPLLWNSLYVSMVLAPFIAILGALWVGRRMGNAKKRFSTVVAVMIVMSVSVALPFWSSDHWNSQPYVSGDTVVVENQLFSDANYLRAVYQGVPGISNTNVESLHLAATSEVVFLGSGIYLTLSGDVKPEDVAQNVTLSNAKFPTNLYIWFEYTSEPKVDSYTLGFMMSGMSYLSPGTSFKDAVDYFRAHSKLLVIVDNKWPESSVSQYSVLPGALPVQLEQAGWKQVPYSSSQPTPIESYSIYSTEGITVYALQIPL